VREVCKTSSTCLVAIFTLLAALVNTQMY